MDINEDRIYNKERLNRAFQIWFYSTQRIDLLIISISGAGIYVVLEAIKFIAEKPEINSISIKEAGLLFVLAVIVNFVSQFTGKTANEMDMRLYSEKLKEVEREKTKEDKLDQAANKFTKYTEQLNLASLFFMAYGLLFLMYFFLSNF